MMCGFRLAVASGLLISSGIITGLGMAAAVADPADALQIRYAANLPLGDSFINITNTGANSTSTGLPGGGFQNGNLCVNVYTYSPDEQLVSCCSCLVTPNGLATLSVVHDLISNTLTPIRPSSVVVKLLASDDDAGSCNPATVRRSDGTNRLRPGLLAWMSTLHALPVTPGTQAGTLGLTETKFAKAALSEAEFGRATQLCAFIRSNGSGYGICKSCRFGGLGAATK